MTDVKEKKEFEGVEPEPEEGQIENCAKCGVVFRQERIEGFCSTCGEEMWKCDFCNTLNLLKHLWVLKADDVEMYACDVCYHGSVHRLRRHGLEYWLSMQLQGKGSIKR